MALLRLVEYVSQLLSSQPPAKMPAMDFVSSDRTACAAAETGPLSSKASVAVGFTMAKRLVPSDDETDAAPAPVASGLARYRCRWDVLFPTGSFL